MYVQTWTTDAGSNGGASGLHEISLATLLGQARWSQLGQEESRMQVALNILIDEAISRIPFLQPSKHVLRLSEDPTALAVPRITMLAIAANTLYLGATPRDFSPITPVLPERRGTADRQEEAKRLWHIVLPFGCGCQSRFGIPFWGRTTHVSLF